MTILAQERERLASAEHVEHARTARAGRSGRTRVIGKPDQFDGEPMKNADWSFKLRSHLGAVDQRYQEELTKTEASSTPRLNATVDSEGSALSTQMYYKLVMTTSGAALDKCHNAGVNEAFEAWRQFVMGWEPKLRTRYVGLLMNVLGYRFRDDIPTKLAAFERTVHENQNNKDRRRRRQDRRDDSGDGGLVRVKEHLIRISVRITSWTQVREEILEITRTQQYIDSQTVPLQLGANPKCKGKGKDVKGKDVKGKGKGKDIKGKDESSQKVKSYDRRKCFYSNKTGPSAGRN